MSDTAILAVICGALFALFWAQQWLMTLSVRNNRELIEICSDLIRENERLRGTEALDRWDFQWSDDDD